MTDLLFAGWQRLLEVWPYALTVLDVVISLAASSHVVIYKRDTRAAVAWVGLIWLAPFVGVLLYVLLGINRIRRRAKSLRGGQAQVQPPASACTRPSTEVADTLGPEGAHLAALANVVGAATGRALLGGNRVVPLKNGEEAYPAMIRAIDAARDSVMLSTYIFDNDRAGRLFMEAFARAAARQVEVRILIDDIGARYSWPTIVPALRRTGVRVAHFMPTLLPLLFRYSNLRNHRKIMVVDGRLGYTGGMNIREGSCLDWHPKHPVQDLHVQVEGPVVAHLQESLVEDWAFCTGEVLEGERWFPPLDPVGDVLARGISDGPDEDLDKLHLTLLGAITCARSSLVLMTPYFLPDVALITTLNVAAMRGVEVDILLPEVNNLFLVKWASTALLWQVLEHGCRVWLTPPPFNHAKLMIVDGAWVLVGSSNWDPRSLRLNFEFDLECYDRTLASVLDLWVRGKLRQAKPVSLADVDGRSLPVKLRDGLARLLTPYL